MEINDRILSHDTKSVTLIDAIHTIQNVILQTGDSDGFHTHDKLQLVNQLSQFDLGRFLLINKGLNGYWTDYILSGYLNKLDTISDFEKYLLTKAPTILATQQRFQFFLRENQQCVKNSAKLLCLPCGLMGELLYLDYTHIDDIQLIGIDLDAQSLSYAEQNASKYNLSKWVQIINMDAWNISFENEFDLIISNGLTMYEPDNHKVINLYHKFYLALKSNGKLVTSFLTPPPSLDNKCEWNMSKIDMQSLKLQQIVFQDILSAKWQCYRTSTVTKQQLEAAGFKNITFIYDEAKMFPTVIAFK